MVVREIIKIDEEKCTGCGICIPNCPEGALQIIDEKARMISDLFCDGLGACIGHCPEGAITIEKREAEEYDERRVMQNVVKQGANTIKAHLQHMLDHKELEFLDIAIDYLKEHGLDVPDIGYNSEPQEQAEVTSSACATCPGEEPRTMKITGIAPQGEHQHGQGHSHEHGHDSCKCEDNDVRASSTLTTWPVQLKLLNINAPYLKNASLLLAADCVGFAYPNMHQDFIKDKVTIIGCPKLDDASQYVDKLAEIFRLNSIKDITILMMEVPCCFGMENVVTLAMKKAGIEIPYVKHIIKIDGSVK